MKVARPAAAPAAPPARDVKSVLIKVVSVVGAILGLIGVSFEMYLYYSPAALRSHAPSAGLFVTSVFLFAGGFFVLNRN